VGSRATRRRKQAYEEEVAAAEPAADRAPSGAHPVLALQQTAGNRATAQVLARKAPSKAPARRKRPAKRHPKVTPLTQEELLAVSADYTNAHTAVDRHFERVRDVLTIRNEVHQTAIENFKTFSKLTDPPSMSEAILNSIFESVIGLIPGGAAIKIGLSTGLFALDMVALKKDLAEYPIPGVTVAEERAKGPSTGTKAKAEKIYERGKTAYDIGKGIHGAYKDVKAKEKAASEAEAEAKESAAMHSGRISDLAKALEQIDAQEDAIIAWLKRAQTRGEHRGGIEAAVKKRLGPDPPKPEQVRGPLEKQYELTLYEKKLRYVAERDERLPPGAGHSTRLEYEPNPGKEPDRYLVEIIDTDKKSGTFENDVHGQKPSKAMLRRIGELTGQPILEQYPELVGPVLKIPLVYRKRIIQTMAMPPRAG
jgi:hypothetical protein